MPEMTVQPIKVEMAMVAAGLPHTLLAAVAEHVTALVVEAATSAEPAAVTMVPIQLLEVEALAMFLREALRFQAQVRPQVTILILTILRMLELAGLDFMAEMATW